MTPTDFPRIETPSTTSDHTTAPSPADVGHDSMGACTCPECEGTGAYKPDCWLCDGEMIIKIEKALAEGYSESDLEDAYDGLCRCPADECRGDSCDLCEGDGTVAVQQREDEITRVLMYGLTRTIPPRISRSHYGRIYESYDLLSNFAGAVCKERGWIRWFRSVLGDEVSLTPSGEAEARSREWGWLRRRDVTLGPVDDKGRLEDDGAPPYSQAPLRARALANKETENV